MSTRIRRAGKENLKPSTSSSEFLIRNLTKLRRTGEKAKLS
ncbi:hypothetical protein V6Z11_D03G061700 [Gossypium hirsutum]